MSAVRKEGVQSRRFAGSDAAGSVVPSNDIPSDSRVQNPGVVRRASMLDAGAKRVVPEGHSKRGISAEMIGKRVSLEASKRSSFESANRVPLETTAKRSMMQEPVLVLNATYEPINVTAVRRAMVLLLKGVAQAEEMHNAEVHSAAHSHKVPSVIRLLAYRHIPQQSRALSRKNILLRDRNTCQFCGRVFPSSELTLDHVVPRSRGGRSSWENLVACCYRCNNSKGNRTPEEVGFKLARRPRPFTLHTSRQLMRMIGHRDDRWRKYLFY